MRTYLYRVISTRDDQHGRIGAHMKHVYSEGEHVGRATGYLSRSSAIEAGERAGVDYLIERSQPIKWEPPRKDRMRSLAVALADLILAGNETAAKVVAVQVLDRAERTS